METTRYPYPIATRISISKERRIRLPKFLSVPVPYVLVEDTRADQLWLGLCGLDALARLHAECGSLRVVAEYSTCRPTIPKAVCDRHGLSANLSCWLVAMGDVVEVWSELSWQTMISNAIVLSDKATSPRGFSHYAPITSDVSPTRCCPSNSAESKL